MDISKRTVTINKTFDAPLTLVWEAWTQPEHIAKWWSPGNNDATILEHDFSVGGKWKYAMPMPDGNEFIAAGKYIEIIELKKIASLADFKPMTEGVEIHALFEKVGEKTNFTFNIIHANEEYKIQQEQMGILNGWGSVFENLEKLLSNLPV